MRSASSRGRCASTLVIAELLRAFGARSEEKLVTEIGLLSNLRLFVVVSASFALQLWIHHSALLARVFRTQPITLVQCLVWIALGSLPLVALEIRKWVGRRANPHPLKRSPRFNAS